MQGILQKLQVGVGQSRGVGGAGQPIAPSPHAECVVLVWRVSLYLLHWGTHHQ